MCLDILERETTETTKTKKTKDPIDRGRPNEVFENLHPKGLIVGVVVAVVAVFMFAAACCYYKSNALFVVHAIDMLYPVSYAYYN